MEMKRNFEKKENLKQIIPNSLIGATSNVVSIGAVIALSTPSLSWSVGISAAFILVTDIGLTLREYIKGDIDKSTFQAKLKSKLIKGAINVAVMGLVAASLACLGSGIFIPIGILGGILATGINVGADYYIE